MDMSYWITYTMLTVIVIINIFTLIEISFSTSFLVNFEECELDCVKLVFQLFCADEMYLWFLYKSNFGSYTA